MKKFCQGAGHTSIPARSVSARRCAGCGTHRRPWSEQDAGRMPAQDLLDEVGLPAATPRASTPRPHQGMDAPAGRDFPGAISGKGFPGGDDADDDAIDAWLRFRPSAAASE